jgi:hypothetical protein
MICPRAAICKANSPQKFERCHRVVHYNSGIIAALRSRCTKENVDEAAWPSAPSVDDRSAFGRLEKTTPDR